MNSGNETPLFRFLLVFICGILLAVYFPFIPTGASEFVVVVSLITFYVLFNWKIKNIYRNRWIAPLAGLMFTFFSGYLLTVLTNDKDYTSHFRNKKNTEGYIGLISQPLLEKEKSYKSTIRIISVHDDSEWISASGNCLVYFSKESLTSKLKYGDCIFFSSIPEEVKPPANPSQFDYKRWLGFNHIYDQVYFEKDKWRLLEHGKGNWLFALSYSLRDRLLSIFSSNKITGQEYAVLSALILGCSDEIDQEVISAYAASGALHVLSVSGLHVGIIYVAINFLLSFLDKKRKTRILKSIVIILFLWFYALLTGLSPSVLRSATMLSFIIVGSLKRRHTKLYNTLAASAFFLLCIDPYLIMQVGFQLSYTAVLGIILLYQPIHAWIDSRIWVVRQIWSVTAVSLAAQIVTFPLGLFYFHQFPVYFLLSNLVVIPISTIIIYGGILLLAFSGWHVIAALIAFALSWIVHSMNAIVIWIEQLPFSLLTGISVSIIETCLMYGAIGALITFFMMGEQKYFLLACLAIVLILASQIEESVRIHQRKQLVVFSIKGSSVINIIDGRKNIMYADDKIINDRRSMIFNLRNYWWDCGVDEEDLVSIKENNPGSNYFLYRNFIQYGNSRLLKLNETFKPEFSTFKLPVDILLISNNIKVSLKELLNKFQFKKIVIDSSCNLKTATRLVREATDLGIDIYSVPEKGAFVYDLRRE